MESNDPSIRVIAHLAKQFEQCLADDGLTLAQYRMLSFLAEGEWAASVLADRLAVSRPSVTALVDGLVERGWVERAESPDDRRRVLHRLTRPGRARLDEAAVALDQSLEELLAHLDDDERHRARDGLALVGTAMLRRREAVVGR